MIGSLTARIFAIFWLTLALVLMLVLMLPKLDSRQMTELLESEQRQGIMIEQHVEAELANDPPNDLMWWRRLFRAIDKWAPPGSVCCWLPAKVALSVPNATKCRLSATLSARRITPTIRRKSAMVVWKWSGLFPSGMEKITTSSI